MSFARFSSTNHYRYAPALSLMQQAAVVDQMRHMLENLGIHTFSEWDRCSLSNNSYPLYEAPAEVPYEYSWPMPAELTTSSVGDESLHTDHLPHCTLLPKPPHSVPYSSHTLLPQSSNTISFEPQDTSHLSRTQILGSSIHASTLAINLAQHSLSLNVEALNTQVAELLALQHGRQHKGRGGTYDRKKDLCANSATDLNAAASSSNARVPSFMAQFMPAPEASPPSPDDQPGTKRCSVGRPLGKVLRPGADRFYHLGRCDKHHDAGVFHENMNVHANREAHYMEREHAWKCSGEATRRPRKQSGHR